MPNQKFHNFILNNFLEHVCVLNADLRIVFCSENTEDLLGFSKAEIIEKGIKKLFLSNHFSIEEVLFKAEKYDEFISTENFLHKTKNFINIAYRVYCQIDEEAGEKLFIFYLRDNTQQNSVRKDLLKKILTYENLTKSQKIRSGKLEDAINEILESSSRAMQITRVNAWIYNKEKTEIQCVGNFDARANKLIPQGALPCIAMPVYFSLFENDKIIISNDALNDTRVSELLELYLKPLDIYSLMDVPIRIEGEIIGVICFENVGVIREWSFQEQKFGVAASQLLSLSIESNSKQKATNLLEISLDEQKVLLQEVNHRVKNNLSIVSSLMNLQKEKSKDDYHKNLFLECKNRLDSISTVHELIYKAKSYSELNFKDYLNQIIDHISSSYSSLKHIKISQNLKDVKVDISYAIPLALIVNELITNAYKHAFKTSDVGIINISLKENNNVVVLEIEDNGHGFDKNVIPEYSIGMDILGGLIDQIDGNCNLESNEKGTKYKISFSKK